MQAMEARMPVTRPNKLLSLWPAYITGSNQTFFGKPNPFNRFRSYSALCLKCFVVMGSCVRLDSGDFRVLSVVSVDVFKDAVICSAFQMRPSVITCVSSSSRNHSCRSELHRGHSSGQSDTLVNKLHQMVTPLPSIHSLSLTHRGVCFWSLMPSFAAISKRSYDHVVEEHFQRSLGVDYQKARSQQLSISVSVDDHFAKALGDKWLQIKSKSSSCSSTPPSSPSVTHSPTYSQSPNQSHKEPTSRLSTAPSHWSVN